MRVSTTKWFRALSAKARAIASLRGVSYPSDDPHVNAELHAEAELQMGGQLERLVRREGL